MKVVYSARSQAAFDTLNPLLQRVFIYIKDVLEIDHTILCGHRGEEEQNKAFAEGKSELKWPDSLHNTEPSLAVDAVPYVRIPSVSGGIHWDNPDPKIRELYNREMVRFATTVQLVARFVFNLHLRWGGDWDKDWSLMDNRFNDYPHFEVC